MALLNTLWAYISLSSMAVLISLVILNKTK
jgi:hypothetical protein